MSPTLFRHAFRMLMRPGRLIGLVALAAVPGIVLLIVGLATDTSRADAAGAVAAIGSTTFPIAALILAAATLRDERDEGTLPYLYLTPIGRPVIATTSIAAAMAATSVVGLAAAAVVAVSGAVVGVGAGIGLATAPTYLGASLGYSAVFVTAGYLVPRVVLVGLAYVIVWEQIVARLVSGVANTSIWRFALSVYADLVGEGGAELDEALGPVTAGAGGGVAKLLVVAAIGVAVLTWALRRRDAV